MTDRTIIITIPTPSGSFILTVTVHDDPKQLPTINFVNQTKHDCDAKVDLTHWIEPGQGIAAKVVEREIPKEGT